MRFVSMVRGVESGNKLPPPKLMEEIGALAEQASKDGTMLITGGLAPTAASVRVRLDDGQIRVVDGPYAEAKEAVGGFAIFDVETKQEAIDATLAFMELHRKHWPEWEGECELREVFGSEDFVPAKR